MNFFRQKNKQIMTFGVITFPFFVIVAFLLVILLIGIANNAFDFQQLGHSIAQIFSQHLTKIILWNLLLWVLYILILLGLCLFYNYQSPYVKTAFSNEHGAARWIVDEEKSFNSLAMVNQFNKIYPVSSKNNNKPGWVVRAKKSNKTAIYNVRSETQALCLGTTGSGKTQKIIIPSAIYNASLPPDEKPCMIFTDPKGELCETLGQSLIDQGYEVLILNLRQPKFSSGWNPLNMAYRYYYDAITFKRYQAHLIRNQNRDIVIAKLENIPCFIHEKINCEDCYSKITTENNLYQVYLLKKQHWLYNKENFLRLVKASISELKAAAYEEVEDLIACLFVTSKNDANPVWTQNAGRMTAGVIYALLEEMDRNPDGLTLNQFNMTTVATLLSNQKQITAWFQYLGQVNPSSKAFITAAAIINSAEVTRQGVFSNIAPPLKIFEDLGVQNITCCHDIDLFKFTEKPKALFLIIPDEKTNRHVLGSLFISQMYKASVFVANQNKGKLPRVLQYYLDEFGNMPVIPDFDSYITVARSRRMFFMLVLQDFKQLYEKYGQQRGLTIKNNCNLNIYIQTNDHDTAEAYSKMIGDYTIISTTRNRGYKLEERRGGTTSQSGIPLIKSADLMRLKDPFGVVIYAKENPAKIYMEYAYRLPNYQLKPFNISKHIKVNVIDFYENHYYDLLQQFNQPPEEPPQPPQPESAPVKKQEVL